MKQDIISALSPSEAARARGKRILPGAGATVILWLLTVTCKEPSVTEAAFPLLFLPLLSITSFAMAGNRAASLVLNPGMGSALMLSRKIAIAAAAESILFVAYFGRWGLNWMPFTLGVIMAVAIGGLAGTVIGLCFPGKKILAASLAAFLQAPSLAGLALIRHPSLLLLPNQGSLEMLDGAFGPLMGAGLMMPLLAGTAWIALGAWTAAKILRRTHSKGKRPQNRQSPRKVRIPSRP